MLMSAKPGRLLQQNQLTSAIDEDLVVAQES
jgi:hypothetical protein